MEWPGLNLWTPRTPSFHFSKNTKSTVTINSKQENRCQDFFCDKVKIIGNVLMAQGLALCVALSVE